MFSFCSKAGSVSAKPGLEVNQSINFFLYKNIFHCLYFVEFDIIQTQN